MRLDPEVETLLDPLVAGIQEALGDELVGVYLRGSLAYGAFDPETSDIDLLAVVERPVDDAQYRALDDLHARIGRSGHPYADRIEVSYIDRRAIRRFRQGERRHPSIGTDSPFGWHEHRDNWILERQLVREHHMTLVGPDPRTLIDPVTVDEVRHAVRAELATRVREWAGHDEPPAWLLPRYYQAFEVETMCRALLALADGRLAPKAVAVAWASGTLPEPWARLVRRSVDRRADPTADPEAAVDVMRFVRWVAEESGVGRSDAAARARGPKDQEEGGAQAGT